jgi:diguanylate cyclase (GGDEF)-like protein/PAS domain S-box-containing protein
MNCEDMLPMFINSIDLAETTGANFDKSDNKVKSKIELLIVDDQVLARESLRHLLELSGQKVVTAEGGIAAINLLKKHPVQLILLDLNMPDLNGHEVLKYIETNNLDTQVIVLSGEANFADARRALRYNFVYDFIKKPYEINILLHSIENLQKMIRLEEKNKEIQLQLNQSEQMHRFLVENSPDIIYLANQSGKFTFLNKTIRAMLGYEPEDLLEKHYSALVYQDDWQKAESVFNVYSPDRIQNATTELRLRCKGKDKFIYVEITSVSISPNSINFFKNAYEDKKDLPRIFGVIRNINDRKLAQNDLSKYHLAIDNSPNFIFITDTSGAIEYANRKITETTGYTVEEVIGRNPSLFGSRQNDDENYQDLWRTLSNGQVWRGVLKNRKKSGDVYWARESVTPLIDSDGVISSYVAIQEDVTEALLLTEKLSYQATHDPLTQLINRIEFDRRLDRIINLAQNSDTPHALCYIDLDQFKIVNDTCSHTAGDELLRQISTQLSHVIRRSDTLARLGGDEFAILMEFCPLEQAVIITNKIHQAIEQFQFHWDDKSFRIGVSIGLVVIDFNKGGSDIHLKQADMACFMAKQAGRNRTHIYRDDDKALAQHHGEMNWVVRINKALEEDLFCLYTQAIVPLEIDEGEHCEILIRMKDRNGCVISPDAFLPAAERYQLSTKIDRWVIHNVFNFFTVHPERTKRLSLCSINLSGSSLSDPNLLSFIENQFIQTDMPSEKVCFEITETAAIANLSLATEFMNRLKEYGCKFSLDDFGSGLSSFAYLKNLPVDFLKIDGFFVKDIEHDSMDLAMVKSINDIGHVLGKKTIAEFVESKEILRTLTELKVDYAQGYYTGKPKPIMDNT